LCTALDGSAYWNWIDPEILADWERKQNNKQPDPSISPDTGKNVAIIGSGPSGLAAAELLRRYGHHVTVYEELSTPGGTTWYGIPDYHLPKDVLLYEIERIKGMGIEIKTGVEVGKDNITLSHLRDGNDAVLITTGSKDTVNVDTPGIDLKGIYDGYQFLESVFVNGVDSYLKSSNKYNLGKEVIVIGGGDSALDCARTALRLTQGNVTIVYRRTESEMPADPIILEEAKEEGIQFRFLAQPKSYEGSNGYVTAAIMDSMQLGKPDESGRRKPEPIPLPNKLLKCPIGHGKRAKFIAPKKGRSEDREA
jgi:glutamate synthase (NADPH) small chain